MQNFEGPSIPKPKEKLPDKVVINRMKEIINKIGNKGQPVLTQQAIKALTEKKPKQPPPTQPS